MDTGTLATPSVIEVADEMMRPFHLGRLDAEDGLACDPEEYYAQRMQRIDYTEGYLSVNPSVAAWLILHHYTSRMKVTA